MKIKTKAKDHINIKVTGKFSLWQGLVLSLWVVSVTASAQDMEGYKSDCGTLVVLGWALALNLDFYCPYHYPHNIFAFAFFFLR